MLFLPISLVASSNAFAAASNSGAKDKVGPTLLGAVKKQMTLQISQNHCSFRFCFLWSGLFCIFPHVLDYVLSIWLHRPETAGAGAAPPPPPPAPTLASTFLSLTLKSCSSVAIESRVAWKVHMRWIHAISIAPPQLYTQKVFQSIQPKKRTPDVPW